IADLYRKQFRPSEYLEEPRFNVALQVICADTEEKAELVLSSNNVSRVNRLKGIREPLVSPEEAIATEFTPVELQHLEQSTKHLIVGTPEMIKEGVAKAAQAYSTTDVSIATNCYYFADRVRSFELVAEAFALNE
ncbi:LLM class flavin-dependent oxidoreductase, partial [Dehalococcoidia bacterium]|nr:LLM class flavin-dependent oxidoreductase [Dehalococcoidia bacterium]